VWQALHEELGPRGFTVVAVALDSGGAATTAQWIEAAKPTYPCLIDERHLVADLYGMVNVPNAVWIDEAGVIVRPAEAAGSSDAFRRHFDRGTKQMSADGLAERERVRRAYFDALRDWVAHGPLSRFALAPDEVRRRLVGVTEAQTRAAAAFRLGQYLARHGRLDAARPYFAEARRLRPESWAYRRQTWELEEPGKAGGAEFWAAVDALGDRPYYPPPEMEGMPTTR
jgi:AhpC/TSA family protein